MVSQAHFYRYFQDISPSDVGILNSREFRSERKVNPFLFITYGVDKLLKERQLRLTPTNVLTIRMWLGSFMLILLLPVVILSLLDMAWCMLGGRFILSLHN